MRLEDRLAVARQIRKQEAEERFAELLRRERLEAGDRVLLFLPANQRGPIPSGLSLGELARLGRTERALSLVRNGEAQIWRAGARVK